MNVQGVTFQRTEEETRKSNAGPYGLVSITKLFRFLCSLISSDKDPNNYEALRLLGLKLINTILESCSNQFELAPGLLLAVQDDLFKYLLQNLQTEQLSILTFTLRAVFTLYTHMKEHLKVQFEIFFNALISLLENKQCSYEKHEIIIEMLAEFCRESSFMVILYMNYDCDPMCSNVFENICKFLYKTSYPVGGSLHSIHLQALEGLLSIVDCIAGRCGKPSDAKELISAEELRKRKQLKGLYASAAEHFNKNPKDGIEFLKSKSYSIILVN